MSFSDPFIRRPVLAIVANLVLAVLGVFALTRLPVRELPSFEVPLVSVVTVYPGASAEQVERQVTTPVEQALSTVAGVDVLASTSAPGSSSVQVTFGADADPRAAANEVRAKVGAILNQLPREAEPPVVTQLSADAAPVLYLALGSGTVSALELTELARRIIRPRLATLPGVADVQILGERRYAMRIGLDPLLLAARGVTVAEVSRALEAQNAEVPSGEIETAGRRVPLLASTTVATPEEFNSLVLRAGPDWSLQMRDVGDAQVGPQDVLTGVLTDGRDGVALSVQRQGGANALDVARAVRAALPDVRSALPPGVDLGLAFDSSTYVQNSVDGVTNAILQAVVLVTAVIFLFLASGRAAFITLVTIPLSLVGTLAFLLVMGYSLNTFSLLAMVLAVGLVVDDAIVDVENVQRHIRDGLQPVDAAFIGSREIGFAIVATTATVAAVFAPIGLMPGLIGSLFREFAFTLAAAVVISGYISRTLSPMMCSRLLRPEGRFARRTGAAFARVGDGYARALGGLLRRRWLVLPLVAALAAVGVLAARRLPAEIAPTEDPGYVFVQFQGTPGASFATMEAQARAVNAVFDSVPERQSSLVLIGTPSRNEGLAFLVLRPWAERGRSAQEIGRAIAPALARVPGALTSVIDPNPLAGGGQPPVQFVIRTAGDMAQLAAVVDQLLARARANPQLVGPRSDLSISVPQLRVEIDRARAADLKVAVSEIGQTFATILGARYVTRFAAADDMYYVVLELDAASRGRIDTLDELFIRSSDGTHSVPLSALVQASQGVGPDAIRHFGQLPAARITATLAPGASMGAALSSLEAAARELLPPGFSYDYDGLSRQAKQANIQIAFVFLLALVFIYLFLAAQFESFRDPLIVLAAVPFAVVGALAGLAAIGGSINIYSAIGIITLVGLVAKNGILVTEFVNQQRDLAGLALREAVLRGSALRLRPILMTATATALGAMPLVLDSGPGAVARNQIGAVIVGGTVLGTLVSLVIVPVAYSLISRRVRKPLVVPPPDPSRDRRPHEPVDQPVHPKPAATAGGPEAAALS